MDLLFGPLASVVALIVGCAAVAAFWLGIFRMPRRVGRGLFYLGTGVAPVLVAIATLQGILLAQMALFIALVGIVAGTPGLLLVARRRQGSGRSDEGRDVVAYLLSSVLWFALLFWSGSARPIEGLHFTVASAAVGVEQPHCAPPNEGLVCNHLTFLQALFYSTGNLVTLGASGITPLDELARFFTLLQMLPVFIAVYVIARN